MTKADAKEMVMHDLFQASDALISECGLYRYWLTRTWSDDPPGCFVMLNPSKADALQDDPTITRCIGFAQRWGWGGFVVVNLFAWRATDPKELKRAKDPVGPENDQHIIDACAGKFTVAAWGANAPLSRERQVWELIRSNALSVECLKFTTKGQPYHPLFVAGATKLIPYRGPQ